MIHYVREVLTHVIRDSDTMNQKLYIRGPEDLASAVAELREQAQEHFMVFCLNSANRLIAHSTVTIGIINASLVHPREIFRVALGFNTASIILMHNHPSGNMEPSEEDMAITKQLVEAGKILGIPVHDHIIVASGGERGYTSLAERGLI